MSKQFRERQEVNSLDDANEAVLEQNKALRIQPPAPGATRFYFHDGVSWKLQKCGHSATSSVDVEAVRSAVKRAIPKNDRKGGGGVTAVPLEQKDRYA